MCLETSSGIAMSGDLSAWPAAAEAAGRVAIPATDRAAFGSAAHDIADRLLHCRVRVRGGGITWLRPDRKGSPGQPPARIAAGVDLYDGIPGIALFLAAMAKVEGRADCRLAALEALRPWRALLAGLVADPARARSVRCGIGGLSGLGSFLYGLAALGDSLGEPVLIAEASRLCGLLQPELIAGDEGLDIVAGSAGTLLALLALDRRLGPDGAERILPLADACAARLAAAATRRADGSVGWKNHPLYPQQTGLAHGAAGMAYALLSLHRHQASLELSELARSAWRFERSTYSPELGNWRDQTGVAECGFLNQWCYGAPGIALGRLATLDVADDAEVRREITDALAVTGEAELAAKDHWCCGEFGKVEVLLFAAEKMPEADAGAAARRAARLLERRRERGGFFGMVACEHPDPTLFTGEAGIGYSLLRLAHPGRLPCVLAME